MARLDLRAQAAAVGLELPPEPVLTPADRAAAIETWRGRMINEHISARIFAGLIPQMMAAEVDPSAQAEVAKMIGEELRHGVQCAAVVHALGGQACADLPELLPVPEHTEVSPLEGFIRNLLSIACLSETVAVALIGRERLGTKASGGPAGPECIEAILKQILADEVGHARFGWRLLDALGPRMDDAMRERLGDYLITAFAHLRDHELHHLPETAPPSPEAEALGVCHGLEARRLFYDTVASVIIPVLERRGLPGAAAWEAAQSLTA